MCIYYNTMDVFYHVVVLPIAIICLAVFLLIGFILVGVEAGYEETEKNVPMRIAGYVFLGLAAVALVIVFVTWPRNR